MPTRRQMRTPRKDLTAQELQSFLAICEKHARRQMGAKSVHVGSAADAAIAGAIARAMAGAPSNHVAQAAKQSIINFKREVLGRYEREDESERCRLRWNIANPILASDLLDNVDWDRRDHSELSDAGFRQAEDAIWIEDALSRIPAREAGVVRRHIVDQESLGAISRSMGISDSRGYQLYAKGIQRMRHFIEV